MYLKNGKKNEENFVTEDKFEIKENDEISEAEILKICLKNMKTYASSNWPQMLDVMKKLEDMVEITIVEKESLQKGKISVF